MTTKRDAYHGARTIAEHMGRTFMEFRVVGKGRNKQLVPRKGTVLIRKGGHPTKRLYRVVIVNDPKKPYDVTDPFYPTEFSASELGNINRVLRSLELRRARPRMVLHRKSKVLGPTSF